MHRGDVSQAGLLAAFAAHHDRPARRVGHAPGRVNLIGEHTDHNGGLCLPFALPQRAYAAVTPRDDTLVRVHSLEEGESVTWPLEDAHACGGWAAYVVGTVASLTPGQGHDVLVTSQVPPGAGLSSSAALTCAVARAVAPEAAVEVLLAATVRAENDYVGAPTGGLDQTIAFRAVAGSALLLDFGAEPADRVVRTVPSGLPGHEWWLVDTRISHDLADGGYAQRRSECAAAAAALGVPDLSHATGAAARRLALAEPLLGARARHVVTENARVRTVSAALEHGDASAVGVALSASHLSLRDDFAVSCPEVDETVDALLASGARGARMVGGGFGGSVLALLPIDAVDQALSAVTALHRSRGWRLPLLLHAGSGTAGAGVLTLD